MSSTSNLVWSKPYYEPIEYVMPKEMAKQILNERSGAEKNMHP